MTHERKTTVPVAPFSNGADYLDYLRLYVFVRLVLEHREPDIEEYPQFEITDRMVERHDRWAAGPIPADDPVTDWFERNREEWERFRKNFPDVYPPKAVIWSDRRKSSYYTEKLQMGFQFELHIAALLLRHGLDLGQYQTPEGQYELGENTLGIEIKNDTLIEKYGNVYIEYQEKANAGNECFVNSGILKKDNCNYFLIGTPARFFIFRKARLREILYEELAKIRRGEPSERGILFKEIPTSKGYVFPVRYAVREAITIEELVRELQKG